MPRIPRVDRQVSTSGQPIPYSSGDAGAVGRGIAALGKGMQDLNTGLLHAQKERDELDMFEAKIALTKFHGEQNLRQIEHDNGIQGDGRDHTSGRLQQYDTDSQSLYDSLPNNERVRQYARLHVDTWRNGFGERSYRTQLNQVGIYKETELTNLALSQLVPNVTDDPDTLKAALSGVDAMLEGVSGLPNAAQNRIRQTAAGLILERWVEQAGPDAKEQADALIKEYQSRNPIPQKDGQATGIERRSDGMATVTTGSGARFVVSGDHADRFKGALDDLEAAGIEIKADQSGGYAKRNIRGTNVVSLHASGRAIDINWTDNPRGADGNIPADVARGVAKKWGLRWGGDWKNPDPMHFEVAKDAGPLPVQQRGVTAYAGLAKKEADDKTGMSDAQPDTTIPRIEAQRDMTRTDGYFVRGLIHNLDKIEKIAKKKQEEIANAARLGKLLEGEEPFNAFNDKDRKMVDDVFTKSDIHDKLFKGDRLTMARAVEASHRLNYVPKPVVEAISGLMAAKDAASQEVGMEAASAISAKNPRAFDKTEGGKTIKKNADEYAALREVRGMAPADAIKHMAMLETPEWQKLESARRKDAEAFVKDIKPGDLTDQFDPSWQPFDEPSLQPGNVGAIMMQDFKDAAREHFIRHGDKKIAMKLAADSFKKNWDVTDIGPGRRLTQLPIERHYPGIGGDGMDAKARFKYVTDQLAAEVKEATGKDVAPDRIILKSDDKSYRELAKEGRPKYKVIYKDENGIDQELPGRWAPDVEKAWGEFIKKFGDEREKAPRSAPPDKNVGGNDDAKAYNRSIIGRSKQTAEDNKAGRDIDARAKFTLPGSTVTPPDRDRAKKTWEWLKGAPETPKSDPNELAIPE